jgi:hypothetical protein
MQEDKSFLPPLRDDHDGQAPFTDILQQISRSKTPGIQTPASSRPVSRMGGGGGFPRPCSRSSGGTSVAPGSGRRASAATSEMSCGRGVGSVSADQDGLTPFLYPSSVSRTFEEKVQFLAPKPGLCIWDEERIIAPTRVWPVQGRADAVFHDDNPDRMNRPQWKPTVANRKTGSIFAPAPSVSRRRRSRGLRMVPVDCQKFTPIFA